MTHVLIYTGLACSYCERAKRLLTEKNTDFEEINIGINPEQRVEMLKKTDGARTVPQIFIDGQHVGGCDDLYALERRGVLDELLAGTPTSEPNSPSAG